MATSEPDPASLEEGQAMMRKTIYYLIGWVVIIFIAALIVYQLGDLLMSLVV